jgi:hypothetical protein
MSNAEDSGPLIRTGLRDKIPRALSHPVELLNHRKIASWRATLEGAFDPSEAKDT